MLQNACFLAKIGADTAENEQHLPKFAKFYQALSGFIGVSIAGGVPHRRPRRPPNPRCPVHRRRRRLHLSVPADTHILASYFQKQKWLRTRLNKIE